MRVQLPSKCLASPPIFLHLSQTVKLVNFLFFGHRLSWFSSLFGLNSNQLNSSNSSLPNSITLLPVKTMVRHTNIQLLKKLRTQSTVTVTLKLKIFVVRKTNFSCLSSHQKEVRVWFITVTMKSFRSLYIVYLKPLVPKGMISNILIFFSPVFKTLHSRSWYLIRF